MTNRIARWKFLQMDRPAATILTAAVCSVWVAPALAAVNFSGAASAGIDYDNNAFDLSDSEEQQQDSTSSRLTVSVAAATEGGGPTQAQVHAQYSQVDSFNTDSLDHSEHDFGGTLAWKPVNFFDVSLNASQTRIPLSLADVGGERSVLQTSTQAQATLQLRPTPTWQIGFNPGTSETKTPLPSAQNFKTRQDSRTATLNYLGATRVVVGATAGDYKGVNSQIANPTRYKTETAQGTVNYRATAVSSFSLAVGYSRFTTRLISPSNDPVALASEGTSTGFSGALSIQRQLTAKTGLSINGTRGFQQYDTSVNPSLASSVGVGVNWAATRKMSASLDASYTWTTIQGVQVGAQIGDRKDLASNYSLSVGYKATRRLSASTYIAHRARRSTFITTDRFSGYSAGLSLSVTID